MGVGMGKYRNALLQLGAWFERQKRALPWRDEPTLYRVWISEIMLQQTQVATVIPFFEKFVGRFPTVESLAAAPVEDVMQYWAGLGYYSRARNLHRGAQIVVGLGRFPATREEWLEIPGVGSYTAGAILSIALNQPEAILDGNVERVLSRIRRVNRMRGDAEFKVRLWRLARAFVTNAHSLEISPSVLNQSLMELGATVCSPRSPKCGVCPLSEICRASIAGEAELYPPRKKPKKWLDVREELHCVLDEEGQVLLRQRQPGEWRAGLWDFLDEVSSLNEVLGANEKSGMKALGTVETRHVVTRHQVTRVTHVWVRPSNRLLKAAEGEIGNGSTSTLSSKSSIRWVTTRNPEVAVGSPLKKTMQVIQERFFSGEALQRDLFLAD